MASKVSGTRRSETGRSTTLHREGRARGQVSIKFGDVVITGDRPSAATVKANAERSTQALARLSERLTRPGVNLRARKDVPLFSAAEDEPGVFIRTLNGRTERGRLIRGAFQVVD